MPPLPRKITIPSRLAASKAPAKALPLKPKPVPAKRRPLNKLEAQRALGAQITKLRKEKGMSQTALAADAKINRGSLNELEGGKHEPGLHVLRRIACALDVSLAELVKPLD